MSIDDDISANKLLWHSFLNSKFLRGDKVVYVAVIKNIKVWNSWQTVEWVPQFRKPQNSHKYCTFIQRQQLKRRPTWVPFPHSNLKLALAFD
jgi:hypothetical protein